MGFQLFRPLVFFKAHEYKVIAHQKRTLRKKSRPARGATTDAPTMGGMNIFQSTRPARGATANSYFGQIHTLFQSTRPARGATMEYVRALTDDQKFQSTRPARGATKSRQGQNRSFGISIHAPREGRDQCKRGQSYQRSHFNPRAPRGARHEPRGFRALDRTHFNPRAPRGARLNASRAKCATIKISIHAPREGRDW